MAEGFERIAITVPPEENNAVFELGGKWNVATRQWLVPKTGATALRALQRTSVREPREFRRAGRELQGMQIWKEQILPVLSGCPEYKWHTQPWPHQVFPTQWAIYMDACLLHCAMGTGKTKMTLDACRARGHQKILLLCPKHVGDVWEAEIHKHAKLDYAYYNLTDGPTTKRAKELTVALHYAPVIIAVNYEASWTEKMGKAILDVDWDCLVLDECHPAGTKIATPIGDKPIEQVEVGDVVRGVDHVTGHPAITRVTHTFHRQHHGALLRVGDTLMTPEHPVWTKNRGYIPASHLIPHDTVCYTELKGECDVKEETRPADLRMVPRTVLGRDADSPLLRQVLCYDQCAQHSREAGVCPAADVENAGSPRCSREAAPAHALGVKSLPRPENTTQGASGVACAGIPDAERWQRKATANSTAAACAEAGLGDRVCCANTGCQREVAELPEDRHCGTCLEDCDRGGRAQPRMCDCESERPEERPVSHRAGLASVALLESRSAGGHRYRGGDSDGCREVFNIETTLGNFFADGLLVHNSHKIKSAGSNQSLFAFQIRAKHKIALTGTPMPHSPLDLYGQYRTLDVGVFGKNFSRFKAKFAIMGGFDGYEIIGWQNQEEMRRSMDLLRYEVKKDALTLPPLQFLKRTCVLEPVARKAYNELEKELVTEVKGNVITAANALVKLLRLQQIAAGYLPLEDGEVERIDGAKLLLLGEMLEELSQERVVVFCRFRADLDACRATVTAQGRQYFEVSGDHRDYLEWRDDTSDNAVVGVQLQAGLGIDLTQASYGIFYTLGFSLGDYDQCVARLHRPGQKRATIIYHLLAENTVDARIARALREKRDVIEALLRGMRE